MDYWSYGRHIWFRVQYEIYALSNEKKKKRWQELWAGLWTIKTPFGAFLKYYRYVKDDRDINDVNILNFKAKMKFFYRFFFVLWISFVVIIITLFAMKQIIEVV